MARSTQRNRAPGTSPRNPREHRGGRGWSARDRNASRALWLADTGFRGWGFAGLAALAATGVMLAMDLTDWQVPFVIAHLCGLIALVPLGLVLVTRTYRHYLEASPPLEAARATIAHDRLASTLTIAALLAAMVSLSQFEGVRIIRSIANFTTVTLIAVLVRRYLR